MARTKGKGQRFDYLFKKFDRLTSVVDLSTGEMSTADFLKKLKNLKEEVEKKETFTAYEQCDKQNLLQQIQWYFNFYRGQDND